MLQPRIARFCLSRVGSCAFASPCRRTFSNSAPLQHDLPKGAVVGQTMVPVDEDGIPLKPSYSIKSFLSSLPSPKISDEQFIHLHKLAALIPPSQGTPEFEEKKKALEEMVRLVEGVRPTGDEPKTKQATEIPDGRIWPENEGIEVDWKAVLEPPKRGRRSASSKRNLAEEDNGKVLLDLASKQVAGYYVVKKRQAGEVE